jgi:polyhydroxyalkanoate synthesis regulator protein
MQDQVRKNFVTFERALGLFSPFAAGDEAKSAAAEPSKREEPQPNKSDDEIANLKAELSAVKDRLDELSRR